MGFRVLGSHFGALISVKGGPAKDDLTEVTAALLVL